jgi:mono/diheme cytochrome c family protein
MTDKSLMKTMAWTIVQAAFFLGLMNGCLKDPLKEKKFTPSQVKLYNTGEAIYKSTCTACHNPNPKLPGAIGPDNYGSSLELVRLKVLKGEYPPGYKPKRTTKEMPEFESYESVIEAIHFYLNN